jgi:hypothetical protein
MKKPMTVTEMVASLNMVIMRLQSASATGRLSMPEWQVIETHLNKVARHAKQERYAEAKLIAAEAHRDRLFDAHGQVSSGTAGKVKRVDSNDTGCSACDDAGYAYTVEGLDGHVNACAKHVQQVATDALTDALTR